MDKPITAWKKKPRVLVVEDDYLIAEMLQSMLEELGCEVVGRAANVKEAVDASLTLEIDAAIVDLVLNGERADPVADALRTRDVPFGFATGMPVEGARGNWKDHPFLIAKPYTIEGLAEFLVLMLPDHSSRSSSQTSN